MNHPKQLKDKSVYIGLSLSNPSLRLGEFRTFLFTYIIGRKNNYKVYIRIDDTNLTRHNILYKESILHELEKFRVILSQGELTYWDDGLLIQSQLKDIYMYYLNRLYDMGVLSEMKGVVSIDIKKSVQVFGRRLQSSHDILRRKTRFDLEKSGYQYIPLYVPEQHRFLFHLPCVVDEYFMNTAIAIRGENLLPVMPIHDMLRSLLKFPLIPYIHMPMLLMPNSSKRLTGEEYSLEKLMQKYDMETILTYAIMSAYNTHTDKGGKFTSLDEFIDNFDINKIKKQSTHCKLY